jgi:hypothetical protein
MKKIDFWKKVMTHVPKLAYYLKDTDGVRCRTDLSFSSPEELDALAVSWVNGSLPGMPKFDQMVRQYDDIWTDTETLDALSGTSNPFLALLYAQYLYHWAKEEHDSFKRDQAFAIFESLLSSEYRKDLAPFLYARLAEMTVTTSKDYDLKEALRIEALSTPYEDDDVFDNKDLAARINAGGRLSTFCSEIHDGKDGRPDQCIPDDHVADHLEMAAKMVRILDLQKAKNWRQMHMDLCKYIELYPGDELAISLYNEVKNYKKWI